MPNPIQARGVLVVIYSIINNDAKPTIAALPLNRSAKRLKPNLVTTNLGWTVGCMFAMIKNITHYWAIQYLFYGCLTRSASGISPTDDGGVIYSSGFAKSLFNSVNCEVERSKLA